MVFSCPDSPLTLTTVTVPSSRPRARGSSPARRWWVWRGSSSTTRTRRTSTTSWWTPSAGRRVSCVNHSLWVTVCYITVSLSALNTCPPLCHSSLYVFKFSHYYCNFFICIFIRTWRIWLQIETILAFSSASKANVCKKKVIQPFVSVCAFSLVVMSAGGRYGAALRSAYRSVLVTTHQADQIGPVVFEEDAGRTGTSSSDGPDALQLLPVRTLLLPLHSLSSAQARGVFLPVWCI